MANAAQKQAGQKKVAAAMKGSVPVKPGATKPPVATKPAVGTTTKPTPMPPRSTAVIPRPAHPLTTPEDYGADADAGFEGMGREDFAIPFLTVLQSQSPQVLEDKDEYIDGARAGMIFNTVTKELYDGKDGILFIPVHRTHQYLEWVPRDAGGGLVDIFQPDDPRVLKAQEGKRRVGKIELDNGNELAESFSVFGLLIVGPEGEEDFQQVLINFGSSQIKHYKQWMTRAASISMIVDGRRIRPPLFAHTYRLTTKGESNKKGNWHGWNIAFSGGNAEDSRLRLDAPWYEAAKMFRTVAMSDAGKSLKAAATSMMPDDEPEPSPDGAI